MKVFDLPFLNSEPEQAGWLKAVYRQALLQSTLVRSAGPSRNRHEIRAAGAQRVGAFCLAMVLFKGLRPESGNAGSSFIHALIQSIHQSIHQSINQSINQSIIQSLTQSFNHSIIRSFNHSFIHSFFEPGARKGTRKAVQGGASVCARARGDPSSCPSRPCQHHEHACARARARPAWSLPLPPPRPARESTFEALQ